MAPAPLEGMTMARGRLTVETMHTVPKSWRVIVDGRQLGLVREVSTRKDKSHPDYVAYYYIGPDLTLHPDRFSGEWANVAAVSCVMDNAEV